VRPRFVVPAKAGTHNHRLWLAAVAPSFRGAKRAAMCNCTPENLEIPGLVLRTIPE